MNFLGTIALGFVLGILFIWFVSIAWPVLLILLPLVIFALSK